MKLDEVYFETGMFNKGEHLYFNHLTVITGYGKTTVLNAIETVLTFPFQYKSIDSDSTGLIIIHGHDDKGGYFNRKLSFFGYKNPEQEIAGDGEIFRGTYIKEGDSFTLKAVFELILEWRMKSAESCDRLLSFMSSILGRLLDKRIQIYFFNERLYISENEIVRKLETVSNSYVRILFLLTNLINTSLIEPYFNLILLNESIKEKFIRTSKEICDRSIAPFSRYALIDNIEDGISPKIQTRMLDVLLHFFPHIQFIVSTNSPVLISNISCYEKTLVYKIHEKQVNKIPCFYGLTLSEIFYNLAGVKNQPDEVRSMIADFQSELDDIESYANLSETEKENISNTLTNLRRILGSNSFDVTCLDAQIELLKAGF